MEWCSRCGKQEEGLHKIKDNCPCWVDQLVGALFHTQKAVGSVPDEGTYLGYGSLPGQDVYGRHPIDVSLSPFFLSL